MSVKEDFFVYVQNNCGNPESGTATSYRTALNKLTTVFSSVKPKWCSIDDVWKLNKVSEIMALYKKVKEEQDKFKKGLPSVFNSHKGLGDSYYRKGWCSAALRFFAQFRAAETCSPKFDELIDSLGDGEEVAKKAKKIKISAMVESLIPDGIDVATVEGKEIVREVKQRVNQDQFRRWMLKIYSGKCCVTGLDIPELLRASHISSWSEDKTNRLNPENGLCLSATYDAAFDKHLISFDDDYRLIVSKNIKDHYTNAVAKSYFKAREGQKLSLPIKFAPSLVLLEKHRKKMVV